MFTFDDHIRCMAAKQHLVRARDRARRMKLEKIAQLLDVVSNGTNTASSVSSNQSAKSNYNSNQTNEALSYNLVASNI